MFPSAKYLLGRLRAKVDEVRLAGETGKENLSVRGGLALTLRYLETRELGGIVGMHARLRRLDTLLDQVTKADALLLPDATPIRQKIARLLQATATNMMALEDSIDQLLLDTEQLLYGGHARPLSPAVTQAIVNWDIDDLQRQLNGADATATAAEAHWQPVRQDNLQAYLRDRFGEGDMEVTDFNPLAGGFGKETVLFSVRGRQLDGDFVIRRDRAVNLIGNDCHLVRTEYPLLKAVRAHGIPTANALWLQEDHPLIPGADFIVMEKVSGITGGSVFGTGDKLDPAISDLLGQIVAQIHTLPALPELGELTESIRPTQWGRSLRDCAAGYIDSTFRLYRETPHFPSVAITAQFNWLLQNIPDVEGRPCLIHGDIGLHNMLLEGGRINALFDWEFAHVGDPAEDLAYVKTTMGKSLDWERFMAAYMANGGLAVSPQRLHFYQVWGMVRNAACGSMLFAKFSDGQMTDATSMLVIYQYGIQYLQAAQALIDSAPAK